jgi:hypothetical protein
VQLFDNQILQAEPNGTVRSMDLLSDSFPLAHANGATFPLADPDILATLPPTDAPDYVQQASAAIDGGLLDNLVPDQWNDLPVNFNTTFHNSVTCADLAQTTACDDSVLLQLALDVWGLPTSAVQQDPNNPDLVSLRFQRGIMVYSQSTGVTQPVPIGKWFKQVLMGSNLPDDLRADMLGSSFFSQYRPTLPLGLARPAELEGTSMASAFSVQPGGLAAADATPVLSPALPSFGAASGSPTPAVLTTPGSTLASPGSTLPGSTLPGSTLTGPGSTLAAPGSTLPGSTLSGPGSTLSSTPSPFGGFGTPGAVATLDPNATPGAALSLTPAAGGIVSGVATPTTPIGPDPCAGDEQIMFAPGKPYVGTDVLIAVTSSRHHDVRTVRLAGPVKSGPVNERPGLNGWVWEWTISPTVDGWYNFTFYADGARPCATSGFNALPAFGATPLPSATPSPAPFVTATAIPTASPSPTGTPQPAPSLAQTNAVDPSSGACAGHLMHLSGNNFGTTQAALNGNVLFAGPGGTTVATILSWTNSTILLTVPTGLGATNQQIVVTTSAGASTPINYQLSGC